MTTVTEPAIRALLAPPRLASFAHCSLPCRDMEEGKRFYVDVMGGEMRVNTPTFAMIRHRGVEIGIGNENCTFIQPARNIRISRSMPTRIRCCT